jgi:phage N-6-adenine-methyltransferase
MKNNIHFSSKTAEWTTPRKLYDGLNEEFKFTLDPCSTHKTALTKKHFTIEDDGLSRDWTKDRAFMNPPYGRAIAAWVAKAAQTAEGGGIVVALLPARTDTAWWQDHVIGREIRFIRGRLKFGDQENSAPFPSAIVVFRKRF